MLFTHFEASESSDDVWSRAMSGHRVKVEYDEGVSFKQMRSEKSLSPRDGSKCTDRLW